MFRKLLGFVCLPLFVFVSCEGGDGNNNNNNNNGNGGGGGSETDVPEVVKEEVSFDQSVYTDNELPLGTTDITLSLTRTVDEDAASYPITTDLPAEIGVPSSVDFAAGEAAASIIVDLSQIQQDVLYEGWIAVHVPDNPEYPGDSVIVSLMTSTWTTLEGKGQFYDNFTEMIIEVDVQKSLTAETPTYRILNPYPAEASEALAAKMNSYTTAYGTAVTGGEASAYIEFWHTGSGSDLIEWKDDSQSPYWRPGVLGTGEDFTFTMEYHPLYAPFNGVQGMESECRMISEGLYKFIPQLCYWLDPEGTTSRRGLAYNVAESYFSLPDAETKVEDVI